MDYETKIYLEKLIEAIDSPDWWSVIVTFIAAVVAATITYVLGKRQNQLQEQQIKLQEQQNILAKSLNHFPMIVVAHLHCSKLF